MKRLFHRQYGRVASTNAAARFRIPALPSLLVRLFEGAKKAAHQGPLLDSPDLPASAEARQG